MCVFRVTQTQGNIPGLTVIFFFPCFLEIEGVLDKIFYCIFSNYSDSRSEQCRQASCSFRSSLIRVSAFLDMSPDTGQFVKCCKKKQKKYFENHILRNHLLYEAETL